MQKVHTTIDKENEIQEEIVRPYDQKEGETINMKKWNNFMLIIYVVLILMGIGTAYLLSKNMAGSKITLTKPMVIKTSTVEGSTDTTTFKDSAEGVLEKGGSNGEGSHKLIREG